MKKAWVLGFFIVLAFSFMGSVLSQMSYYGGYGAGSNLGWDLRYGSAMLIDIVVGWSEPFLQFLLGGYDYTGFLLFEKFLLFLLLMSVVYVAIRKVPVFDGQKGVIWTISIIIPLLSVRFLDFMWLNTVFLNYKVLGVVLLGILPFIVFLFFVHSALSSYPAARKIAWIFFIVVYYGMWSTSAGQNYGEIYFWTMLMSFLFLLLDGTIQRYLMRQKWADANVSAFTSAIARIDNEIARIQTSASIPEDIRKRELSKLYKRRSDLQRKII